MLIIFLAIVWDVLRFFAICFGGTFGCFGNILGFFCRNPLGGRAIIFRPKFQNPTMLVNHFHIFLYVFFPQLGFALGVLTYLVKDCCNVQGYSPDPRVPRAVSPASLVEFE